MLHVMGTPQDRPGSAPPPVTGPSSPEAPAPLLRQSQAEVMARWVADDQRLDWMTVPLHKVLPGDVYANHATVTKSRKARAGEVTHCSVMGEASDPEDCWHIKCGKRMTVTAHRGRPVVIGRRRWGASGDAGAQRSLGDGSGMDLGEG